MISDKPLPISKLSLKLLLFKRFKPQTTASNFNLMLFNKKKTVTFMLPVLLYSHTFKMAAAASWEACLVSSPLTDRIWSPCISRPSSSAALPLTTSDMNTPLPLLKQTKEPNST